MYTQLGDIQSTRARAQRAFAAPELLHEPAWITAFSEPLEAVALLLLVNTAQ